MKINVLWFDAGNSRRYAAVLLMDGDVARVQVDNVLRCQAKLADINISSRLGNVPRRLEFVDSGLAIVDDNDAIDALLTRYKTRRVTWLYAMETRKRWIALLLIVCAMTIWGLLKYAVPAAATSIAPQIEKTTLASISSSVYQNLIKDKLIKVSQLSLSQQSTEKDEFMKIADRIGGDYNYRLLFHEIIFPNAFALPDGLVIMDDRLIKLLTDEERVAVFAHEIGHIKYRHGMRAILQSAGIFTFLTFMTGDVSLLLSGGAILLNLKYSRDFEHEADCFAYQYLKSQQLSEKSIGEALEKIENAGRELFNAKDTNLKKNQESDSSKQDNVDNNFWHKLLVVISTHPATESRFNLAAICDASN